MFSVTQPVPLELTPFAQSDLPWWTNSSKQHKDHLLQLESKIMAELPFHCFCENTETPN